MSIRFVTIDREPPMLLPPSRQEWLPETHIARFIVQIVETLPLSTFKIYWRGTGDEQYAPSRGMANSLRKSVIQGQFSVITKRVS